MHTSLRPLSISLVASLAFVSSIPFATAATAVPLGMAGSYVVLAGSTVTNTGPSVLNGNLGLSPGTSVTGFPPGTLNGTQHVADTSAVQAQTHLGLAYTNAAGQTPVTTVPTELGGTTKIAGIYDSAAGTFGITGTLTLDGQNNPNSIFVFKASSTLITGGSSIVSLINGAQPCNVFWQVGSSATLGTYSTFKGTILALTSATLTTGANVEGRVLVRNGAVTLDTNTITQSLCAAQVPGPTPTPIPTPVPTTPPTVVPTEVPTVTPTVIPTDIPTIVPTSLPTALPTSVPTVIPSSAPAPAVTQPPVPGFPNTGTPPERTPWQILLPAGALLLAGIVLRRTFTKGQ